MPTQSPQTIIDLLTQWIRFIFSRMQSYIVYEIICLLSLCPWDSSILYVWIWTLIFSRYPTWSWNAACPKVKSTFFTFVNHIQSINLGVFLSSSLPAIHIKPASNPILWPPLNLSNLPSSFPLSWPEPTVCMDSYKSPKSKLPIPLLLHLKTYKHTRASVNASTSGSPPASAPSAAYHRPRTTQSLGWFTRPHLLTSFLPYCTDAWTTNLLTDFYSPFKTVYNPTGLTHTRKNSPH